MNKAKARWLSCHYSRGLVGVARSISAAHTFLIDERIKENLPRFVTQMKPLCIYKSSDCKRGKTS